MELKRKCHYGDLQEVASDPGPKAFANCLSWNWQNDQSAHWKCWTGVCLLAGPGGQNSRLPRGQAPCRQPGCALQEVGPVVVVRSKEVGGTRLEVLPGRGPPTGKHMEKGICVPMHTRHFQ